MREYRYLATEDTVEALRLLRGEWVAYRIERDSFVVRLANAVEVRIGVERATVEPEFDAFRLVATSGDAAMLPAVSSHGAFHEAPDLTVGRNDVVLFTGATWIEGGPDGEGDGGGARVATTSGPIATGREQSVQFSGHPGQIPESAAAVCLTTDALVVASPIGTGFLVRTGVRPYAVEVTDIASDIARFLTARGYESA